MTDTAVLARKLAQVQADLFEAFDAETGRLASGMKQKLKNSLHFSERDIAKIEREMGVYTIPPRYRAIGFRNRLKVKIPVMSVKAMTIQGSKIARLLEEWRKTQFGLQSRLVPRRGKSPSVDITVSPWENAD